MFRKSIGLIELVVRIVQLSFESCFVVRRLIGGSVGGGHAGVGDKCLLTGGGRRRRATFLCLQLDGLPCQTGQERIVASNGRRLKCVVAARSNFGTRLEAEVAVGQRVAVWWEASSGLRFDGRQGLTVFVASNVEQQITRRWIAVHLFDLQLDGQFDVFRVDGPFACVLRENLCIVCLWGD